MSRPQTNDGRLHLAAPCHVYGSPPGTLTAAGAAAVDAAYDVVSIHKTTLQGHDAAFTHAALAWYTKTAATADGSLGEACYAHRIGGARKYDPTWKVYTTQPDNAVWQLKHLTELKTIPAGVPQVFSDALNLSYAQGGGPPAKPAAYLTEYTLEEWLVLLSKNVNSWGAAAGKQFIVNGLSATVIGAFNPCTAMVEGIFNSPTGKLPTLARWVGAMNTLIAAQAKGFTPWAYVKLFTQDAAAWAKWRNLAAPSMYIADTGSLLFELGGAEGAPPPWVTQEYTHRVYSPGIGRPLPVVNATGTLADYSDPTGAFVKRYQGGVVAVNPTPAGISLTLEGTPIPIDPQSGLILKRSVVWEPIA